MINSTPLTILSAKNLLDEPHITKMFMRCTEKKYADQFMENGSIRFGTPQEWINRYVYEGDGRGDFLEGCFACLPKDDMALANLYMKTRPEVETIRDERNNYLYFRSKNILQMRAFCLFGLDKYDFTPKSVPSCKEGIVWQCKLKKQFFEAFYNISAEKYYHIPEEDRPVLLMISDPSKFVCRLKQTLNSLGIHDEEWSIHPIGYVNKKCKYLMAGAIPAELYAKDLSFEYQKEIRVVIHSSRYAVAKKLEKCNGVINLGPMNDISMIQDYYFSDMIMQLDGDNSMLYSLQREIVKPIEDLDIEPLLGIVQQALDNNISGVDLKDDNKCMDYIKGFVSILQRKYGYTVKCHERVIISPDKKVVEVPNEWQTMYTIY